MEYRSRLEPRSPKVYSKTNHARLFINNPSLAAQQKGQERLLNTLFDQLYDDLVQFNSTPKYFPTGSPIYGITHLTTPLASSPIASQA